MAVFSEPLIKLIDCEPPIESVPSTESLLGTVKAFDVSVEANTFPETVIGTLIKPASIMTVKSSEITIDFVSGSSAEFLVRI